MLGGQPGDRGGVIGDLAGPAERRQRQRGSVGVGERDPDPPLAEVDPEDSAHGALPDGPGLGDAPGLAPATLRSSRKSSVGIDETKPGQVSIVTVP